MLSVIRKFICSTFNCGSKEIPDRPDDWRVVVNMLLDENTRNLNDEERYRLAEQLTYRVYPQYLFSEYGRIFLENEEFRRYYEKFMDSGNWHSYDRKFFLGQLLGMVEPVTGDLAECGCYKGASAYLMCEFASRSGKRVHLFDSFEGLPGPGNIDGEYWNKGDLKSSARDVEENLRRFNCFSIYRGWIPDQFHKVNDQTFCFVHIDVDLYEPTLASLAYFYDRMSNNGIILLDDYGFKTCPGAKAAVDEFLGDKAENLVMVPTGQALLQRNKTGA